MRRGEPHSASSGIASQEFQQPKVRLPGGGRQAKAEWGSIQQATNVSRVRPLWDGAPAACMRSYDGRLQPSLRSPSLLQPRFLTVSLHLPFRACDGTARTRRPSSSGSAAGVEENKKSGLPRLDTCSMAGLLQRSPAVCSCRGEECRQRRRQQPTARPAMAGESCV